MQEIVLRSSGSPSVAPRGGGHWKPDQKFILGLVLDAFEIIEIRNFRNKTKFSFAATNMKNLQT